MGIFHNKQNIVEEIHLTAKDKIFLKKIVIFTEAMDRFNPPMSKLMWRSFLQGIFFSLGTTVGLSILIGVVTFLLSQARVIPTVDYLIEQSPFEKVIPEER